MKKFVSMLSICLLLCSLFTMPASAAEVNPRSHIQESTATPYATNYFSGITGTMNSMAGTQSGIFNISSGSVPTDAKTTTVGLSVTVSRGSIPFYIVVKSPSGALAEKYISASGSVTFAEFKDINPKGTWQIYIYNTGSSFTDVSTATARMTVNYQY